MREVIADFGLDRKNMLIEGIRYRFRDENGTEVWEKWVSSEEGSSMGRWEKTEAPKNAEAELNQAAQERRAIQHPGNNLDASNDVGTMTKQEISKLRELRAIVRNAENDGRIPLPVVPQENQQAVDENTLSRITAIKELLGEEYTVYVTLGIKHLNETEKSMRSEHKE